MSNGIITYVSLVLISLKVTSDKRWNEHVYMQQES